MHGHAKRFFTNFEPLPTDPLFQPYFPPQHTTSLKIIRGVGSFTGIFSEGVQGGPVLGSGWASAGRMGATEGGVRGSHNFPLLDSNRRKWAETPMIWYAHQSLTGIQEAGESGVSVLSWLELASTLDLAPTHPVSPRPDLDQVRVAGRRGR